MAKKMTETIEPIVEAPMAPPLVAAQAAIEVDEEVMIVTKDDLLPAAKRRALWQSRRPSIDHLADAVVEAEGVRLPLFDVGDRIVVDRRTELLNGNPWLDTIVGKVRSIDDDTGLVTIWDEDTDARNPAVRYVSIRLPDLQTFKLAPLRGNPFDASKAKVRAPVTTMKAPDGTPLRRGRGRPKGTKNRPKAEILAEKEARKNAKGKKS